TCAAVRAISVCMRVVVAVLAVALGACGVPSPNSGPSGACRLPPHGSSSSGLAYDGPFVDVPAGCSVFLGEADSGRRLRVQPGTTVHVDLPTGSRYTAPSVGSSGPDDVLDTVARSGNSLTLRAGVPGVADLYSNQPGVKSPPVTW